MNNLKTFWFNPQTPLGYNDYIKNASGIDDEKIIAEIIENYFPSKKKIIADLGIGTGRELVWIDKLKNIKEIIGLDYSPVMIDFVKNNIKINSKICLIVDDLFNSTKLLEKTKKENSPIIFLSLLNTFGNFSKEERILVLKNIFSLMKSKDRIILALYKKNQNAKLLKTISKSPRLETKDPNNKPILAELIEYGLLKFFWTSVMDKYNQMPRFWYDKKNNDVAIHIDGKRLLASHRFDKEEIMHEFKTVKLKIENLIEGNAMWVVVGKI